MTMRALRLLSATTLGVLLGGVSGRQAETRTFVIRVDADTVATERITGTADSVTGDLHLFQEQTNVHYTLHLRPDGSVGSAVVFNEAPNFFTGTFLFGPPSANLGQAGVAGRVARVPTDYLPVIGTSMGLIDYLLRLHARDTSDAIVIKVINIRNQIPGRLLIKRLAHDSALVDCEACMRPRVTEELRIGLTRDGGIDGGLRTEQRWSIARR